MKKRNLLKSLVAMTMIIGSMTLSFSVGYPTREEIEKKNKILDEMRDKYTYEQMLDQIEEEVYGREGWFKTGGKDGKMLDGTPAPNAPGNTKPACDHSYYKESAKEATCTEKGKKCYIYVFLNYQRDNQSHDSERLKTFQESILHSGTFVPGCFCCKTRRKHLRTL